MVKKTTAKMTVMRIRRFSELIKYRTFEERYRYLKIGGEVGRETFGFDRYLNQRFYQSVQWKQTRDHVIARDMGCDLSLPGYEIYDTILIHHMNPIVPDDIIHGNESILDPEYLVCVSHRTHNAIHYGDEKQLVQPMIVRRPGDTRLW